MPDKFHDRSCGLCPISELRESRILVNRPRPQDGMIDKALRVKGNLEKACRGRLCTHIACARKACVVKLSECMLCEMRRTGSQAMPNASVRNPWLSTTFQITTASTAQPSEPCQGCLVFRSSASANLEGRTALRDGARPGSQRSSAPTPRAPVLHGRPDETTQLPWA